MIVMSVMYPNKEGGKFDADYYVNTHIPLVKEKWGDKGMTDVRVVKGVGGMAPGQDAEYQMIAQVTFESMEAFQKAAAESGKEIFADVPNFTDIQPTAQINEVVV